MRSWCSAQSERVNHAVMRSWCLAQSERVDYAVVRSLCLAQSERVDHTVVRPWCSAHSERVDYVPLHLSTAQPELTLASEEAASCYQIYEQMAALLDFPAV